ncbi:MarR family winged helix-turn-helix transcriptional regulator [Streptomyces sp. MB09-02B]|uniref:MarR family winged helix-turn-helix transcriptional regulator n=1 Tax=Streptomyces sp. MB09-02B TaxID=3028667 RepID=UPI0029A976D5|nr:MarR family transcriptional regulator [Streptomyces sp. MB09-02B]MDX3638572.1 MarR family transcriptional regulator [Streptomyces sp. MB09-02B]
MSVGDEAIRGLVDDEAVTLYGDVLRLTDAIGGRAERIIREASGLSGSEFEVLLRLARHPGNETTSARLAEDLSFTSGGLTRLIARMEAAGLLARQPHPSDGRAVLLQPTAHGRDLLARALRAHIPQLTGDLLDPLTRVERLILRELVTKLLTHSSRGTVRRPTQPQPLPPSALAAPGQADETDPSARSNTP